MPSQIFVGAPWIFITERRRTECKPLKSRDVPSTFGLAQRLRCVPTTIQTSRCSMRKTTITVLGLAASALWALPVHDAAACGCFTPPDPSVPIVQAGERILFAMQDGVVTAHIQIQ